ncbi:hypothetical protein EST38_g2088 [Candolleomyces aberdarensis]|uniref:NACHT domain-containing protein n=1 Tax=Candolleomyces aberdarensis TaxID=2316362 RepID=A0A4Q2DTT4_9AGAR|nr:hypothetical protein EST38_g2088 [Candolleomyces aberdarensis]
MDGSCSSDRRISQHGFENSHHFQLGTANFSSAARDVHNYNISAPPGDGDETDDKLIEQICKWLTKVSFGSIYSESSSKATEGTGIWFVESEKFRRWKLGGTKILWGTGKPGAGKTTLSSIAIKHLQKDDDVAHQAPVIFAFCRYTEKYSPTEIFASWIQQLLLRDTSGLEHVRKSFRTHERDDSRPSDVELHQLMSAIVKKFNRVFIVLDGLDEADEDARKPLLDFVNSLPSNTHALIMSRPLGSLQRLFPCAVQVDVEARNEDIERFVEKKILDIPSLHAVLLGKDAVRDELCAAIKLKSGGMFLIASLQIEALKSCISVQSLMKKLETLPIGLNELYDHTLERIEAQGQEKTSLAKRVLLWVTYALQPMSIEALQEAVAIELDSKTFDANRMSPIELLLDVCCGLVAADTRVLGRKDVRLILTLRSRFTLLHMAVMGGNIDTAEAIMNKWPALSPMDRSAEGKTPIMLAAGSGLESMLEFLLSRTANDGQGLNARATCGCTALAYAVGQNQKATIQLLLSKPGIDVNVTNCDTGLTPLARAVLNNDEAMVRQILLNPNLNINARNPWTGYTALMQASGELDLPGASVAIVELLMSHPDIDINLGPRCGCTPLITSTYQRRSGIISKLISHPHINLHARCNRAGSALSIAVYQMVPQPSGRALKESYDSCLELISAQERILRNADEEDVHLYLRIASRLGLQDMAIELISKTQIRPKAVALVEAAKAGYTSIVAMLLEHVDVNAEDSMGRTALSAAVMKGHSNIVNLFLARQDILVNKGSIPPLIWAIRSKKAEADSPPTFSNQLSSTNSQLPIARQLLCRTDIDINVLDSMGRVPLTCAMEAECWEIVNLLLSRPDVDISLGKPPALVQACLNGQEALVQKLLARDGLNVNAVDQQGRSALSMAAHRGHGQIVELLLSRPDVNVNMGSPTPLMHACHQGHIGIVKLLLTSRGDELDINLRAEHYECRPTALWFACFSDKPNSDIIQLLLQRSDMDVNIGLTVGRAACKCANTLKSSKRLLPDHRKLPTPLHVAALQQKDAIPLLLASPGINVNALNMDGKTPFIMYLETMPLIPSLSPTDSFLSHPAVLEEPFGSRALISAAANNTIGFEEQKLNEIKTILSRGRMIDVNFHEPNGRSVLSNAAFRGSTNVAAFLLSLPSIDPNSGNPPPLAQASIRMSPPVVQLLLEHPNIDLNRETDGLTALGGACMPQHATRNSVKLLLSQPKVNVNAGNPSPLSIAVRYGHIGTVKLLLEHPKIDVNSRMQCAVQIPEWVESLDLRFHGGRTWAFIPYPLGECHLLEGRRRQLYPLKWPSTGTSHSCLDKKTRRISRPPYATRNARDPFRQKPCNWYAKPEGSDDTILVYCTRFGLSEVLELLLPRADLNVNVPGNCGCTALIWACSLGKWVIVDTLLSRTETTVDARCPNHGHNALVAAAHRMRFEMVHLLLSHPRGHEMDPNVFAACGCNLLVCASRSGDEDTIHNILPFTNWRDYPNAQDCKFGRTALQWASHFGHDSLVQLFLSAPSVSVDHRDKRGNTALMLAVSGGHYNVVRILLASPKVTNVHSDCNSNGDTALSLAECCIGAMDFPINHERPCEKKHGAPASEEAFHKITGPVHGDPAQGHPFRSASKTPVRVVEGSGKRLCEELDSEGSPGSDHGSAKPLQESRKLIRGGSSGVLYSDATAIPGRPPPAKNDAHDLLRS